LADEHRGSILDTAEVINLSSNSRAFFGLSLIISIVSADSVVLDDTFLSILLSSKHKISNTQLTYRYHDIQSVSVPL
jgi:hypothetical protein